MSSDIAALVKKARRSLAAARRLSEEGDHDFAASRAYYAIIPRHDAEAFRAEVYRCFAVRRVK